MGQTKIPRALTNPRCTSLQYSGTLWDTLHTLAHSGILHSHVRPTEVGKLPSFTKVPTLTLHLLACALLAIASAGEDQGDLRSLSDLARDFCSTTMQGGYALNDS
jgi:hypothetical protein